MKMFKILAIGVIGCFMTTSLMAQNIPLTPERVFSEPNLSGSSAIGVKLSPDGKYLSYLRSKQDRSGVQDLWIVDIARGGGSAEPKLFLDSDQLTSPGKVLSEAEKSRRERMRVSSRGIVDYSWSEDSAAILVPVDGEIFLVDKDGVELRQMTSTQADEVDAKLSPNGANLSYVRDGALYIQDVKTHAETRISPQAHDNITYGGAEFIAQEELERFSGYWWGPNSKQIAYTMVDETGVDILPRLEVGGDSVSVVQQRYPRAGRPNAVVELYIASLGVDTPIVVDLGDNRDIYLARVNWSKDGKTLYVQRLSRDQQRLDLLAVDPHTGASKIILSETSNSWVELHNDFRALKDGSFIWSNESDGNKHLYHYTADGKLIAQLTKGDWPVDHLSAVDEAKGLVYFEASKDSPLVRQLYRVNLKGGVDPTPLTSGQGWWATTMSASGKVFVGSYSDPKTPTQTGLYDAAGKRIRFIEENALNAKHAYFAHKDRYRAPEFGTLKAEDGQTLYWSMLKPVGFDARKTYPVIVSIYGGPGRALVNKSWVTPANRLFQEAGYIVFTLDNRGTPNRSASFGRTIYKRFGGPDIDDQIMGAKWLQSQPFVDGAHIGIMGWSQGGFVTLMALSAKDSPFVAGAAGASPTQWSLYDTAYTERYMSTPEANKDGYAASDVLGRLDNIKSGSLLLMHGLADDNVQLSNTTRVMLGLQQKSIPFELMLYPGERHGVRGNAKSLQRYRLYLDFFGRKLKGE